MSNTQPFEGPTGCGMCSDGAPGWLPVWQGIGGRYTQWGEGVEASIPCTCALGEHAVANFLPYKFLTHPEKLALKHARMSAETKYRAALSQAGKAAPASNVVSDFDPDEDIF